MREPYLSHFLCQIMSLASPSSMTRAPQGLKPTVTIKQTRFDVDRGRFRTKHDTFFNWPFCLGPVRHTVQRQHGVCVIFRVRISRAWRELSSVRAARNLGSRTSLFRDKRIKRNTCVERVRAAAVTRLEQISLLIAQAIMPLRTHI